MSALDKLPDLTGLPPSALETMGYIAFGERVSSFTPYFILAWVDVFLLGVAFVVFAQWYTTCRRTDRKISQLLVYWIMIMACAFSGVYQGFMCFWFANGFGIYRNFFNAQWVKAVTILGAAVRVPAMVFYLHRAYALVHNRLWIVYLVALPIAYTAAAPIAQIWLLPLLPYTPTMQRILATSSACEVVADLCITTVISVQLYRSRTGWASTDRLITKLLFTIAETQTPPTIMASLTLILFYAIPNTSMQVLVIFSPKVTVLSILFTLLARVRLAEETRRDGFNNQSKSISGLSGSGSGSSSGAGGSSKFTSSNVSANGSMGMGTVYGDMKAKRGFGRNLGLGFGKRTQGHGQATNRVDRWGRSTAAGQGESFGSGSQGRTIDLGSNAELGFGAGRGGEVGRKESEEVMQVDKEGGSRVRLVSDNVGTAL